jgi:choloylglycine hydrolase
MEKKNIVIPIAFLIALYLSNNIYPCTTFCLKADKDIIFGRNLDFSVGLGYVTINKRNVTKTAFIEPPEKQITWTSKYGSITFNQIGREFP